MAFRLTTVGRTVNVNNKICHEHRYALTFQAQISTIDGLVLTAPSRISTVSPRANARQCTALVYGMNTGKCSPLTTNRPLTLCSPPFSQCAPVLRSAIALGPSTATVHYSLITVSVESKHQPAKPLCPHSQSSPTCPESQNPSPEPR